MVKGVSDALRRPTWYVQRARSMPLGEIPFRLGEQVQRVLGRRQPASPMTATGGRTCTGLADLILRWRALPDTEKFWADQAREVAGGEITVFGQPWPTSADGIPDWEQDPMTGYRWPDDYCFDVPLVPRATPSVEVKYVWELNRLLYLLPVAAHARTTGDRQAGAVCRAHLLSWLENHPPRRGIQWRSGIELAVRVLVFVLVLELLPQDDEEGSTLETEVARAVADHVEWIRRFPSRFSSANNHRVAELTGLLVAAAAYPDLARPGEVDRWWSELDALVLRQFHRDGVPAEQATMYGFAVLEWLAICLHLARRQQRRLAAATQDRITSAAHFLAAITDVAGNPVRFGDDDDSRLLTSARRPEEFSAAVQDLVAQGLAAPTPEPSCGLTTFADGGYTVWRAGVEGDEVLCLLDHGPLGMGHLAAHAHADTLGLYLHVGGRPVLVDAGTYLYHSVSDWRNRLRQTAEHNTVTVEGDDSSVMAGPFNWRQGARAEGRLVSAGTSADSWWVEAEHDGYDERHGVVHRRRLEGAGARALRIIDRLEGNPAANFRWSLLVAPGFDLVPTVEGWSVREGDRELLSVALPSQWRVSAREEAAWCSPSFGRIEPASRLLVEGRLSGTTSLVVDISIPSALAPVQIRPAGAS